MEALREKIRLSGDNLKLFAIVAMLVDHTAFGFVHQYLQVNSFVLDPDTYTKINKWYEYMRDFGRLAFPIFAFMLVEGFFHTRNRMRYALRIAIFALISEIPFNLGMYNQFLYPKHQNVMFSLLLGLIMMMLLDYYNQIPGLSTALLWILNICTVSAAMDIAQLTFCDYKWKGPLAIFVLYIFHEYKPFNLLAGAASFCWEKFAPASFVILFFYDESKKPSKAFKYFFYLFYPAHLLLIYLLVRCLL